MKKTSLILFVLFNSLLSFSQINIIGSINSNRDTKNFHYLEVFLYDTDSVLISKKVLLQNFEIIKDFEIKIDSPGAYILNTKGSYLAGKIDFYKDIKVSNDTSIEILLEYPLQYKQPCRNIFYKNNKKHNLPLDSIDIKDYKRTLRLSRKLNLQKGKHKKFIVRLWEEGAFEYGGGTLYEILTLEDSVTRCNVISYNSNYLDIISKKNVAKKYESEDNIYNNHLAYQIMSTKSYIINQETYSELLILLKRFIEAEDYCINMIQGDRHPAMDGVSYYFEVNKIDFYSFTSFENPECIDEYYNQLGIFLEIKNLIESNIRK